MTSRYCSQVVLSAKMETWRIYVACLTLFSTTSIVTALNTIYLPRHCNKNIRLNDVGVGAVLLKFALPWLWPPSPDPPSCEVALNVDDGHQMLFTVLGSNSSNCNASVILYGMTTQPNDVLAASVCDSASRTFVTPSNTGIVKFSSSTWRGSKSFKIMVTDFQILTGNCTTTELHCENQRCIHSSLWCNGYDNCGDGSDCKMGEGPNNQALQRNWRRRRRFLKEEFDDGDGDFQEKIQYFFIGFGTFGIIFCICFGIYYTRKKMRMRQTAPIPAGHPTSGSSQDVSTVESGPDAPKHPRGHGAPSQTSDVQSYSPSFTKIGKLSPPLDQTDVQPIDTKSLSHSV